jgi:shikimate kinase / 3-dehydroquinate synthase
LAGVVTDRSVVLIGFMGAGKSTVARELGRALDVEALDSDVLLEERLGHSIAREFELHGEESFRAAEEELVCELLGQAGREGANGGGWSRVIALGGGSVLSSRVRAALAGHVTVFLDVDPEVAWGRLHGSRHRPLAQDRDSFFALAAKRRELYEELADAFVPGPGAGGDSEEVVQGVLRAVGALGKAPAGTRLVWASAAAGEYPVLVGRGLVTRTGEGLAHVWPLDPQRSRPFCVTDETVGGLYGERLAALGQLVGTLAIGAGESHKTLASAERVWRELAMRGMTRSDHVVALGGGVVGDLAGFCAATYQRGVAVVQVPSTLVAQVDSAFGGKTGVDLPDAKNYVGAYHQPAGVIVDPELLRTLPQAELAAGWVEVLKTALIAGGTLWERVSTDEMPAPSAAADEWTILECIRTKLAVVAQDERDGGRRQELNLGHTVGHAIETATGYARYRHGEAVGLGLLAALRLSGAEELRERVRELLAARGLPVSLRGAGVTVQEIVAASARDKKRLGEGPVPFVLIDEPGRVRIGCPVDEAALEAAVAELVGA